MSGYNAKPERGSPGFIKTTKSGVSKISPAERTALIRKGNELFNSGDYKTAVRIFITTRYSDGLIRMGDYYMREKNPVEAMRMYWLAPAPDRFAELSEKAAVIISNWLKEEEKVND